MNSDKLADVVRGDFRVSFYGNDGGIFPFAHPPNVQVRDDSPIWTFGDGFSNFFGHWCIHLGIQQDSTAITQQTPRPNGD
ncbi:hypothetical protein CtesDRAFT_PD2399 [Comamonas testosteroni KF-1]|uniref:Uncharacterized protein n=1 Tax=Comamonas testosteroni (strain DSM 14576 / KF-1) TaxID=399795 RepID=B7WTP7_COMTK|nr:hypothetical protein CtesDRAFT_PD2399 [Comamonas testosteroni KF-1]